ncbi:hypothetical protein PIB30_006242 [Stylosanthes scabra]|uniref:Uncharacterized protein n=1 Tax=Stylosanthes scabra TaxID=79078 RepID=A0ABU6Z1B5_9FABA|nr:hypothetical protein [Stylosanthes scabra]
MVCLGCLLPLFLLPIIDILFYYVMGKVYWLFGWEYRKPDRASPACPYNPVARRGAKVEADTIADHAEPVKPGGADIKQD